MATTTLSPYLSFQLFDLEHLGKIIDRAAAASVLTSCEHEEHWGLNDGMGCSSVGTVTNLATEQTVCLHHFRKAVRR